MNKITRASLSSANADKPISDEAFAASLNGQSYAPVMSNAAMSRDARVRNNYKANYSANKTKAMQNSAQLYADKLAADPSLNPADLFLGTGNGYGLPAGGNTLAAGNALISAAPAVNKNAIVKSQDELSAEEFGAAMGLPSESTASKAAGAVINTMGNSADIGFKNTEKALVQSIATNNDISIQKFQTLNSAYRIDDLGAKGFEIADLALTAVSDYLDDNKLGGDTVKALGNAAVNELISKVVARAAIGILGTAAAASAAPAVVVSALVATAIGELASHGIDWLYNDISSGNFEKRMREQAQAELQAELEWQEYLKNPPLTDDEKLEQLQAEKVAQNRQKINDLFNAWLKNNEESAWREYEEEQQWQRDLQKLSEQEEDYYF